MRTDYNSFIHAFIQGGKYVRTPLDSIGLCPFFSFFFSVFKKCSFSISIRVYCTVSSFSFVIMEGEVENYCPYFLFLFVLIFFSIIVPRAYNNVRYSCTWFPPTAHREENKCRRFLTKKNKSAVKLTQTRAKTKRERWVKFTKWGKNWEGARGQGV